MQKTPLDDFLFFKYDLGGKVLVGQYRLYKGSVYYWDDGPQAESSMQQLQLHAGKIVATSKVYIKDDVSVYQSYDRLDEADAKTFTDIGGGYGKDARHVVVHT